MNPINPENILKKFSIKKIFENYKNIFESTESETLFLNDKGEPKTEKPSLQDQKWTFLRDS